MSHDVVIATASLRSGGLLQPPADAAAHEELSELAATLPEIFGTLELGCLSRIAQRLGADANADELFELLLLSDGKVQVVRPLIDSPDQALIAVSQAVGRVGLVLSRVQARLSELEGRK